MKSFYFRIYKDSIRATISISSSSSYKAFETVIISASESQA
jgi:hypothetical protein